MSNNFRETFKKLYSVQKIGADSQKQLPPEMWEFSKMFKSFEARIKDENGLEFCATIESLSRLPQQLESELNSGHWVKIPLIPNGKDCFTAC